MVALPRCTVAVTSVFQKSWRQSRHRCRNAPSFVISNNNFVKCMFKTINDKSIDVITPFYKYLNTFARELRRDFCQMHTEIFIKRNI